MTPKRRCRGLFLWIGLQRCKLCFWFIAFVIGSWILAQYSFHCICSYLYVGVVWRGLLHSMMRVYFVSTECFPESLKRLKANERERERERCLLCSEQRCTCVCASVASSQCVKGGVCVWLDLFESLGKKWMQFCLLCFGVIKSISKPLLLESKATFSHRSYLFRLAFLTCLEFLIICVGYMKMIQNVLYS